MASGTANKPQPTLYNKLYSTTTDATGNVVLGADFDSRCIVNVQVTNTLVCWSLGVGATNTAKMLHFTDHTGTTLASTAVVFRVFWFDPTEFANVEVT
jgi:hypothetical protein